MNFSEQLQWFKSELSSYHEMLKDGFEPHWRHKFFLVDVNTFYAKLDDKEKAMFKDVKTAYDAYGEKQQGQKKIKNGKKKDIGYFLLGLLIALVAISILTYVFDIIDDFFETLIFVACSGGIGGLMYSIRGFYKSIIGDEFHPKWAWWYLYRPLLSMVAGVFVMFLVKGGLFAIGVSSEIDITRSTMFFTGLAFIAGFSFSKFANWLYRLSSVVFAKTGEEDNKK